MRLSHALFVPLVGVGLATGQPLPSADYYLDLTAHDAVVSAPIVGVGSGSATGIEGSPAQPLPLALRLAALDRQDYIFGGPITYVVLMTNVGANPIQLPWSADRETIESVGTEVVRGRLALRVTTPSGVRSIGATALSGAQQVPQSSVAGVRPRRR